MSEAELKAKNFLLIAVERIKQIGDDQSRKRFAEALAASLRFDVSEHSPPRVMNADEIEMAFGISKDEQEYYCIVIRRKQIKEFAQQYGRVLKSSDITRLFKTEAYEAFFGKPIPRLASNTKQSATVYTCAEVLQRADVKAQIDLPEEVKQLFRNFKIEFLIPETESPSSEGENNTFIQLTVETNIELFTPRDSNIILNRVRDYLGSNKVAIINIEPGSVKINLLLDVELAENLLRAVQKGDFSDLNITNAKVIGQAAAAAILKHKERSSIYDVFCVTTVRISQQL